MRLKTTVLALAMMPTLTLADEISGEWCSDMGMSILIEGRQVRAPSGETVEGNYSRHRYEFAMPGSGDAFVMHQQSEEMATVTIGTGAPETWTRCKGLSS